MFRSFACLAVLAVLLLAPNLKAQDPGGGYYSRYYDPSYRPPVGHHYVQESWRSDGVYVRGHYQTNADNSFYNNWSTVGNVNPYTGRVGTKVPPTWTSGYSRRR